MSDTPRLRTAIVLFTRDLRVHDNPALDLACRLADRVVPLFVLDDGLGFAVPNRARFLHQSLADLRDSLRERGGDLVVRHGDPVAETLRLAREVDADGLVIARDVSAYAQRRLEKLEHGCQEQRISLQVVDSVTIVRPGAVTPAGGGHFKVFTPYWRAWAGQRWRAEVAAPDKVSLPEGISVGQLPGAVQEKTSPGLPDGGESAARRRMDGWLRDGLAAYADRHDDLPGDATSRLSAYLHFGCLSPLELADRAGKAGGEGGDAYVRQLCWRDFHAQVTAAFPELPRQDYRPRRTVGWQEDAH
ncbi:MAG TPA: deoxyribodipyrimidine photo-lyase, partial [Trebonia sp.]